MIKSDKEYKSLCKKLEQEEKSIEKRLQELRKKEIPEEAIKEVMGPIISFKEQIKDEIHEYEQLKQGNIKTIRNFTHIGRLIIGLRIKKGLSQRELAKKLGVSEQSVCKDEAHEYYNATVKKLERILEALDEEIEISPTTGATPAKNIQSRIEG